MGYEPCEMTKNFILLNFIKKPLFCFLFRFVQVACVVHSAFVDGDRNCLLLSTQNGCTVTRDQLKASFLLGESFIELMFNFSIRFNAFQLTQGEVALFSALMLITPGRPEKQDVAHGKMHEINIVSQNTGWLKHIVLI